MVAYLRQFLVVLLVLLQTAAPMVHAHIGHDGSERGLHLHEFETLHINHDGAVLMAEHREFQAENGVVNVGSAIKQQPLIDKSEPALCLLLAAAVFLGVSQTGTVHSWPYVSLPVPEPILTHNPSRAPPV